MVIVYVEQNERFSIKNGVCRRFFPNNNYFLGEQR